MKGGKLTRKSHTEFTEIYLLPRLQRSLKPKKHQFKGKRTVPVLKHDVDNAANVCCNLRQASL